MHSQPNVTFSLKTWDEKLYNELPGELKMTRSSVVGFSLGGGWAVSTNLNH